MSKTVHVESPEHFSSLLSSSTLVVTDFYADWCGPCKQIAPIYETLSQQLSRPNKITFTKVNTDQQQQLSQAYSITAIPTFMVFKHARTINTVRGADVRKLSEIVKKLANEANTISENDTDGVAESSGGSSGFWLGAGLPKGYKDVTDQVDVKGLELLNCDSDFGNVRTLFEGAKPTAVDAKGKGGAGQGKTKDWVESDTDEQLMLFVPFQSMLKVHSLHITSLPPSTDEEDGEVPLRPKTLKIYSNRAHVLGFEEADDIEPTQMVEISEGSWNGKTGTAKLDLRFVKFQNVTSLVVFVVDGQGEGEKVRVDRVRIIGETGEKRDLGKLEKVGDGE